MDAHREKLTIRRMERLVDRLRTGIVTETIPLDLTVAVSDRPVPWNARHDDSSVFLAPRHAITEGETWGSAWQSGWFHGTATIPAHWDGLPVAASVNLGGEALLFDAEGTPVEAFSGGSVWDPDFIKTQVPLFNAARAGDTVELWIEAAANAITGIQRPEDPAVDAPDRHGSFIATVNRARLALVNETVRGLVGDVDVLLDMAKALPAASVRRARIVRALSHAADLYADNPANAQETRTVLAPLLAEPAEEGSLTTVATGHAHIDTAWLWPVRETVRKCARTFANQLRLIERYPSYVFGASQPQHYQFVKDHYPGLYEQIKAAVRAGRWEVQGGMWVEADCNLIDGESLVRQIMHGTAFFRREFGVDVRNVWLPDVFGYSAALPQIMKKSGIDSFLTQKISWNQFNRFPHHTFWWRGIDGSEVLAHFPPEDSYNSPMRASRLLEAQDRFAEKDRLPSFMTLFGVGDGGGGPAAEYLERGERMHDLAGVPQVEFAPAQTFFDRLHADRPALATWAGELYLEFHRGTLTTQAAVKRGNRKLEQALREAEALATLLPATEYPRAELDRAWKLLLLNQFHDIIPGSSINEVYEVTHREHAEGLALAESLARRAMERVGAAEEGAFTVANTLDTPVEEVITFQTDGDDDTAATVVVDDHGVQYPTQREGGRTTARVRLAAGEIATMRLEAAPGDAATRREHPLVLENDLVRYEFAATGRLIRAYDKELDWDVIAPGEDGNAFTVYEDRPNDWDAWDIDIFYEEAVADTVYAHAYRAVAEGPARVGTEFDYAFGDSSMSQRVYLRPNSKRLDFETTVQWYERHRMLRVAFPTTVLTDHGNFDVQYGYVRRANHRNTSWDMAKFESVGQRYADLSQPDRGVALLNDCKYGYKVLDGILDLNLLRSPVNPDAEADRGEHRFVYALLPHVGGLVQSTVMAEAAALNRPPRCFAGLCARGVELPVAVESDGVGMEVLKRGEEDDALYVRLVERLGATSRARIVPRGSGVSVTETDLLERPVPDSPQVGPETELTFSPFSIRTFRVEV